MQPYRPDRVVRVLTATVSFAYFGFWVLAVLGLLGMPLVRGVAEYHEPAEGESAWSWGIHVPVSLRDADATVQTGWGSARLVVEDAYANLQFNVEAVPWGIVALLWLIMASALALMLLILNHLRRIFQRVRDGAVFDAQNALRMRSVGLLLLAAVIYDWVLDVAISIAMRGTAGTGDITVSGWFDVDMMGLFMALVVVALAEVFRRGAELEDEQALVV